VQNDAPGYKAPSNTVSSSPSYSRPQQSSASYSTSPSSSPSNGVVKCSLNATTYEKRAYLAQLLCLLKHADWTFFWLEPAWATAEQHKNVNGQVRIIAQELSLLGRLTNSGDIRSTRTPCSSPRTMMPLSPPLLPAALVDRTLPPILLRHRHHHPPSGATRLHLPARSSEVATLNATTGMCRTHFGASIHYVPDGDMGLAAERRSTLPKSSLVLTELTGTLFV
jgi:hypothetical protein